jgi:Gentisate 1,2-dioxygenase
MTQTQQPTDERELTRLYADFDAEHLTPLWTQLDELMPTEPDTPCGAIRVEVVDAVPAGPARR